MRAAALILFHARLTEPYRFMVEKLPEGGEGMAGYDDGEGDD